MAEERFSRKLAAILAADVVGYSRRWHPTRKRHRQMLFEPTVAAHHGRIVKLIGDGTVVEFASVVDAVNCAISVQRAQSLQDATSRAGR
jgi:adenylate cyclase